LRPYELVRIAKQILRLASIYGVDRDLPLGLRDVEAECGISHRVARELYKIRRRGIGQRALQSIQAVSVEKTRLQHPEPPCERIHLADKSGRWRDILLACEAAAHVFGERLRRLVVRLHHRGIKQVANGAAVADAEVDAIRAPERLSGFRDERELTDINPGSVCPIQHDHARSDLCQAADLQFLLCIRALQDGPGRLVRDRISSRLRAAVRGALSENAANPRSAAKVIWRVLNIAGETEVRSLLARTRLAIRNRPAATAGVNREDAKGAKGREEEGKRKFTTESTEGTEEEWGEVGLYGTRG
jgi:hypothetical protein